MKPIEEIKAELQLNKEDLAKKQHFIEVVAKTDFDKFFAQMEANKLHHIITTLEWVLGE